MPTHSTLDSGLAPQPLIFCGDAAAMARRAALTAAALGPFPAVMVFGQKGLWAFAFGCLPAALCLAGLYHLLKRVDRLQLDDSTQMIVPYLGRPVPYGGVRALRFETDAGLARVLCQAGSRRPRVLIHAVNAGQLAALRQALKERCPEVEISEKRRPALKAVLLVAGLFAALHAGFLYYCRQKWPVVTVACEAFEWPAAELISTGSGYELDGMRFSIPDRFEPIARSADSETQRFRDSAVGEEIRVHAARLSEWLLKSGQKGEGDGRRPIPNGKTYLGLLGIHSTYDLMRWPYCDRIGAIPVVLKAALIPPGPDPWELDLYETEVAGARALIQVESSPGDHSVQILWSSGSGEDELLLTLSGEEPINRQLIATLLKGLELPEGPALSPQ